MNLNEIKARPFVEGTIRAEATKDPANDRLVFSNTIEILARHHIKAEGVDGEVRKLAAHPIAEQVAKSDHNTAAGKIVEVPIRMFFGKAENSLSIAYQAFNQEGMAVCRGDGVTAKRLKSEDGQIVAAEVDCAGADACDFACSGQATCRRQVSMAVQIKDQPNPLSVFELRSSSINTYKALKGQLKMLQARFGSLRHIPLKLQLWQASNHLSQYEMFDAFSLALDAKSEIEAMQMAKAARKQEEDEGLNCEFDSMFDPIEAVDMGSTEDFVLVQDFYQPIEPSTRPKRRAGSVSVAAKVTDGAANPATSAKSMIDIALASVKPEASAPVPAPAQVSPEPQAQVAA